MHSSILDDLTREHLAQEAAKCLKNISVNTLNVSALQKELLELNLSITTYIEESKTRLKNLRLHLANQANSSNKVVEILSEKCMYIKNMSQSPATSQKLNKITCLSPKLTNEDNNNTDSKYCKRQNARTFISWYKQMIDDDRQNFALYLSDDITLEWFGRTIKSRKKVSSFLRYDMQYSRHDFRTVDWLERIPPRQDSSLRKDDTELANPLNSLETCNILTEKHGKKRPLRSNCNSPEWAENCGPDREIGPERKKMRNCHTNLLHASSKVNISNRMKDELHAVESSDISSKGDYNLCKRAVKRKCFTVTPPNVEKGQGDCFPSTSGTDSDKSHDTLNAQLPRQAVECNGYIEFTRTRNNRSIDSVKWERKCKVQISYSEDPLNVGEYIIWSMRYHDESKCRRNLLAAFEEVAKGVGSEKK